MISHGPGENRGESENQFGGGTSNPLDTSVHDSAAPKGSTKTPEQLPRWLSVNQIKKMQRMRRETVVEAMLNGELPFEQRGRIRYARLSDVIAWEERRTKPGATPVKGLVHPDLAHLA